MSEVVAAVIAKDPGSRAVKTRLAAEIGCEAATDLALAMLVDTLTAVAASGADRYVVCLDGSQGEWLPPGFEVIPQVPGGLDDRLAALFVATDAPTFVIGMDTPHVTADLVDAGLGAVTAPDAAAFGPAADGGYWGIGLHGPCDPVFLGVPMSTAHTGAVTRDRIEKAGLRIVELPELADVDDLASLAAVLADCPPRSHTRRRVAGTSWESPRHA